MFSGASFVEFEFDSSTRRSSVAAVRAKCSTRKSENEFCRNEKTFSTRQKRKVSNRRRHFSSLHFERRHNVRSVFPRQNHRSFTKLQTGRTSSSTQTNDLVSRRDFRFGRHREFRPSLFGFDDVAANHQKSSRETFPIDLEERHDFFRSEENRRFGQSTFFGH